MGALLLAATAFVGTHFLLSHPWRAALVERLGHSLFALVYSSIAIATFLWLALAWRATPPVAPWWSLPDSGWAVASLVMLAASVLFAGSLVGNPALPAPGAQAAAARAPTGVFAITRHPMMWSFALWAAVHFVVWPTAANAVLTGAIALLALGGAAGQDRRKGREMGRAWIDWRARTSFVPFARIVAGRASWRVAWPGLPVLLSGAAIWLLASWAHGPVAGQLVGVWRL